MHNHGGTLACKGQQGVERRPSGVLARSLVDRHILQLPLRILVESADPYIADSLTLHYASKGESGNRGLTLRYPHESRRSASDPEQCIVVGCHPFASVTYGRNQLFQ